MAETESRVLRTHEERLAFARSMNLFSTPFLREVFKDRKAEGEERMCAITQSIFDEGEIAGAVRILRNINHFDNKRIIEIIKEEFQLNDYQAKTFVYPMQEETA